MRRFHSYGPVMKAAHYFAPREELVQRTLSNLIGSEAEGGGHYFTIWAPRQHGKTWLMHEVLERLATDERFIAIKYSVESLKDTSDLEYIRQKFCDEICDRLKIERVPIDKWDQLINVFLKQKIVKPIILLIDEFDAIKAEAISAFVGQFRQMYLDRESHRLHGLALIGVRSVLGVDSKSGSPFNIQRSIRVPPLTYDEVLGMFADYQKESGQKIEPEVVDTLYYETRGNPGLVGWLGELLVEEDNDLSKTIDMSKWQQTYAKAQQVKPNNTLMNLIGKARDEKYKPWLLKLFNTDEKLEFSFDQPELNYLYMHGHIDYEQEENKQKGIVFYARFSCPLIQKRLFNAFGRELFDGYSMRLDPMDDLKDAIDEEHINLKNVLRRYKAFIEKNAAVHFKHAPRRNDGNITEATFHFHLYHFLSAVLHSRSIEVFPEFPTGNGKVDLLLRYRDKRFALELKSFYDLPGYEKALIQCAHYGKQLGLSEITLGVFIEGGNEEFYQRLEQPFQAEGVAVVVAIIPMGFAA